ncbi:hypothetical protein TNCV_4330121 [Trichonephila clavipes]|nr:hypothetical protein TNCV_4330121 [Trichonephila clavipes]
MGYKRSIHTSRSEGPERKRSKGSVRQGDKRRLLASANSSTHSRKRSRQAEASIQERDIGQYNLRHRIRKEAESRPSRGEMQDQGGPVRSRGRRFQVPRPYNKDPSYKQQSRRQSCQGQEPKSRQSSRQSPHRRGARQQQRQEMGGK